MPTRLRDLSDTDFGTLNSAKNKNIMRYNASTGKFDVIEIDSTLSISTVPPQQFINIVRDELNYEVNLFDGGTF